MPPNGIWNLIMSYLPSRVKERKLLSDLYDNLSECDMSIEEINNLFQFCSKIRLLEEIRFQLACMIDLRNRLGKMPRARYPSTYVRPKFSVAYLEDLRYALFSVLRSDLSSESKKLILERCPDILRDLKQQKITSAIERRAQRN